MNGHEGKLLITGIQQAESTRTNWQYITLAYDSVEHSN